jgi:GH24 family phage-related lysozyme (muramidase)
MTLSQEGVRFIEQHEGNAGTLPANQRLTGDTYGLYNDSAGHCTEGIGHLVHHGRCTAQDIVDYYNRHPVERHKLKHNNCFVARFLLSKCI